MTEQQVADGTNGNDGAPGLNGADGTNGVDGATGPAGLDGTNGNDGATGSRRTTVMTEPQV